MKKLLKAATVIILFSLLAFTPPDSLVGSWKVYYPDGRTITVKFNKDSTYIATDNDSKELVKGNYYVSKDTFAVKDGGCLENYWGKYKMSFYGADSLNLKVLEDSCGQRKEGIDGVTARRLPANK